jgi:glucose/arabinose dehydrogenase
VRRALVLLALTVAAAALAAPPAGAAVSLLQIGSFSSPVYVTAPPGDTERVFVVEQGGTIQVVRGGAKSTFVDLKDKVFGSGEQGLLSMAFAPDYATSGKFYVFYTAVPAGPPNNGAGSDLVVAELRRTDADHADPATLREVLRIPHRIEGNHNGGQLQFGPDGLLYVGTGDGGAGNDSHDNARHTDPSWNDPNPEHDARLGKILRIDPSPGAGCDNLCTIPAGNPGFGQPEIWAYGLRNPWRFSFDRTTGDLLVGDVGQGAWEEIDYAPAPGRGGGANFGWPYYEGTHAGPLAGAPAGTTMPVIEKSHGAPDNFVSITGGYVVRDPALPDLLGRYVYGDYALGQIRAATVTAAGATGDTATGLTVGNLSSFGEDGCGRVYAASLAGAVYRLAQSGDCVAPGTAVPVPGGPAPSAPPAADKRPPVLTLRAATRQRPWRTGTVRLQVRCDENCSVQVRGTFSIARAKARAARTPALRTAQGRARLAAGARVTIKLKVSKTVRRSLARALRRHRVVRVRLAVDAKDAAGNPRRAARSSRIVR